MYSCSEGEVWREKEKMERIKTREMEMKTEGRTCVKKDKQRLRNTNNRHRKKIDLRERVL